MNVGVMGVNFVNKGAELMLTTIRDEVADWPEAASVCLPLHTGTAARRSAFGARHLLVKTFRRLRMLDPFVERLGNLLPRWAARRLDLVRARDLDLLLDASGFAYSDQWGLARIEQHARLYRSLAGQGIPIVLMPQAYGPFESAPRRRAFGVIAESAALVFARDPESADHARSAAPGVAVEVAPDFTAATTAADVAASRHASYAGRACLIPNLRLLDKLPAASHGWYRQVLTEAHRTLAERGLSPFFLLVERGDRAVVDELKLEAANVEVVHEPDPLAIKALIGAASVVVGSRYHGLVSALAQGVPSVGIGWSHKYEALFDEYGCPDMLLREGQAADAALDRALDPVSRPDLVETITARAADVRAQTVEMWARIRQLMASADEAQPARGV